VIQFAGLASQIHEAQSFPDLAVLHRLWLVETVSFHAENSCENLERETGIEPATPGLGSRCSTIELLPPGTTAEKIILWRCLSGPPAVQKSFYKNGKNFLLRYRFLKIYAVNNNVDKR